VLRLSSSAVARLYVDPAAGRDLVVNLRDHASPSPARAPLAAVSSASTVSSAMLCVFPLWLPFKHVTADRTPTTSAASGHGQRLRLRASLHPCLHLAHSNMSAAASYCCGKAVANHVLLRLIFFRCERPQGRSSLQPFTA
jgi:hypothetical protein